MEKSFMDPVHGFIVIDQEWLLDLVDTPEFQRLRRIRQLGVSAGTYHGAEHSRFGHSLGAFQIMKRVLEQLAARGALLDDSDRNAALAGALLHDVGHGPFSHALEELLTPGRNHEDWGEAVVTGPTRIGDILRQVDPALPAQVASLVRGDHPVVWLRQLVSSQLDVDRCDYLLRDSLYSGTGYGRFDLERIIHTLRVHDGRLVLEIKGLHAAEEYVLARHFMYWRVYLHKTIRAHELMLRSCFRRLRALWEAGDAEPVPPPLRLLWEAGADYDAQLETFLSLDDVDVLAALKRWRDGADKVLADLSRRILDRDLLKPLYPYPVERLREETVEEARERTRRAGWDPDYYCLKDVSGDMPYTAYEEPGEGEKPGQEPILILTSRGEARELSAVSPLIRALTGRRQEAANLYVPAPVRDDLLRLTPK